MPSRRAGEPRPKSKAKLFVSDIIQVMVKSGYCQSTSCMSGASPASLIVYRPPEL